LPWFIIATATLTVILAIPTGIERIISNTGQHDIVIATAGSFSDEASSQLSREQINILSCTSKNNPSTQNRRDSRGAILPYCHSTRPGRSTAPGYAGRELRPSLQNRH